MMGAGNRQVRRALAAHGFDDEAVTAGTERLTAFLAARLGKQPSLDPRIVGDLDAWENRWFPITDIVLRTNHPDVHAIIFRNLRQAEGVEVVATVTTLLDRLDLIVRPAAEGGMGELGQVARRLLEQRGLDERVVSDARGLLARIGSPGELDLLEPEHPEAAAAAEQALWNWYLEWSGIARVVIRDRRLLRLLGFLRTVRRPDGREEDVVVTDEDVDTDEPEPEPTPVEPEPIAV